MRHFALVIALLTAASCSAQQFRESVREAYHPIRHVWRYIRTHKELLASDAIILAAWSADAGSTINDEHNCQYCVETNSIVGPHPSELAVWSYSTGAAAVSIAGNHLAWHYAPEKIDRHLVWFSTIIIGISEAWNVPGNVQAAEGGPDLQKRTANYSYRRYRQGGLSATP